VIVLAVVVIDDAAEVSLIKSLLSIEGDARAAICTIVSTDDDEGDREGSRRWNEKLLVRFYWKKIKKNEMSLSGNCVHEKQHTHTYTSTEKKIIKIHLFLCNDFAIEL